MPMQVTASNCPSVAGGCAQSGGPGWHNRLHNRDACTVSVMECENICLAVLTVVVYINASVARTCSILATLSFSGTGRTLPAASHGGYLQRLIQTRTVLASAQQCRYGMGQRTLSYFSVTNGMRYMSRMPLSSNTCILLGTTGMPHS